MAAKRVTLREEEDDLAMREEIIGWLKKEYPTSLHMWSGTSLLYDGPVYAQPVLHCCYVRKGGIAYFTVCWDRSEITVDGPMLPDDGLYLPKDIEKLKSALHSSMHFYN